MRHAIPDLRIVSFSFSEAGAGKSRRDTVRFGLFVPFSFAPFLSSFVPFWGSSSFLQFFFYPFCAIFVYSDQYKFGV